MIGRPACLLLWWLLFPAAGFAAGLDSLYEATVPVANRSDAEFAAASSRALAVVLVKLTGNGASLKQPGARGLLAKARRLVTQFGYEQAAAAGNEAGGGTGLTLKLHFDGEALSAEMRQAGFALWGREQRPKTLVWLVVTDTSGPHFAGPEESSELLAQLQQRAQERGIPIVAPILDLAETGFLQGPDVGPELATTLLANSSRYGTETVLIGRLTQRDTGHWEAHWVLHVANEDLDWEQQGELPAPLIAGGVDITADALSQRFANPNTGGGASVAEVTVRGVQTAEDYARVLNYLRSFDAVTALQVRHVEPGQVVFRVTAHGGQPAVAQSIRFGRMLTVLPDAPGVYQLNP